MIGSVRPEPTVRSASSPGAIGDDTRARVRAQLIEGVSRAMTVHPTVGPVEITLSAVRRAHQCPEAFGRVDAGFAWKPAFARRSLGLAAVRACADGRSELTWQVTT